MRDVKYSEKKKKKRVTAIDLIIVSLPWQQKSQHALQLGPFGMSWSITGVHYMCSIHFEI